MSDWYILEGHQTVRVHNMLSWARWFENSRMERIVAQHLLDNAQPWLAKDLAEAKENLRRRVKLGLSIHAKDNIADIRTEIKKILISTVFLGFDHGYGERVLLFETLVFRGPLNNEMERYTTWEEAERGHADMIARVMVALQGAWDVIEGQAVGSGK